MGEFAGILATVLQKDNDQFFCDPCGNYGRDMNIPCGSTAALVNETAWAVPVKAEYVQGFRYVIADTAPTDDSIAVFKLTNLQNGQYYWVIGSPDDYYAACAACCDASPVPTLLSTVGDIAPEQYACTSDGTNYIAYFAVSALAAGYRYVSRVTSDGVLINQQTYSTGSTSKGALVTYLNTHASSVGTWANPSGNIITLTTTVGKYVGFIACEKNS